MADNAQTEGLKLISEWCKWLVAVQSAGIGLIATLVKGDGRLFLTNKPLTKLGLVIAMVSFVCSIVVAGAIFSAIPTAVADIGQEEKVMDREIYFLNQSVGPIWIYSELLFGLFLFGIVAFATSVVALTINS